MRIDAEPAYPEAALMPGPAGQAAEDAWRDAVLLWGRTHRDRLARVCSWAVDLGMSVPKDYCNPS